MADASEHTELMELSQLFGSQRMSSIPVGLYVKFEVSQENIQKAELARQEREERDRVREERRLRLAQQIAERKARVIGRNEQAKIDLRERNLETGKLLRQRKAEWDEMRDNEKKTLFAETKAKADFARANDGRLDGLEEASAEAERREAAAARRARIAAARSFRSNLASTKRERAEAIKSDTKRAISHRNQLITTTKTQQAEKKRLEAAQGEAMRQAEEQARMARVAANREATLRSHTNAIQARNEVLHKKMLEGQRRDADASTQVRAAKTHLLRDNQQKRLHQFSSRYVTSEEAALFDQSQFRHYYLMDEIAEDEIARANSDLLQRIKSTAAITDNNINDDLAGEQRARAAAESRARKIAEAKRIQEQNAALQNKLMAIKAVVDVDVTDEAAGAARIEAAAASKARREAEAAKLKQENLQMRERLKAAKAVTDDDVTDDVTTLADGTVVKGGGRDKAAAESKARKAAEAKARAKANAEMKEKIKNTAARTDDDVNDDIMEGGKTGAQIRKEKEAALKKQRAEEQKKRDEENAKMKERLKNVKAVVDDDISDEMAGKARGMFNFFGAPEKKPAANAWFGGWGGGSGEASSSTDVAPSAGAEAEAKAPASFRELQRS